MLRVVLRGMAGRKLRSALTAIAIVLGVAMMSGAYVLTDTIDRAFDQIFVDSYAGTDAVVTGKGADISFEGESSVAPPVPEELLERVRSVDGVEVATGSVQDFQTKLLRADGEEINRGDAPSLAGRHLGVRREPPRDALAGGQRVPHLLERGVDVDRQIDDPVGRRANVGHVVSSSGLAARGGTAG